MQIATTSGHKMQRRLVNLYRLILSDRNTRNLFFFLLVNLVFAFVELFYGLLTNSLGLISDSFHMFFDCSALLLGLAASIVAKWKPSDKFTYGFGRAEVLAGLANGLFLLFIALFIMKEAIERTFEPPEVHHERLFVISVLGFLVNLIGIFVFQHGGQAHHHLGSGGCSHSHSNTSTTKQQHNHHVEYTYDNRHGYSHYSNPIVLGDSDRQQNDNHHHSNNNHNHHHHHKDSVGSFSLDMNGSSTDYPPLYDQHSPSLTEPMLAESDHNHHDHHDHHHGHNRGQIMQSVFLHIVADTLGSVGVMISAVLMNQFGWMIADPLCSLFIAILISISVYPLLRDSIYILMQRTPVELDSRLPDVLFKLMNLEGVQSVQEAHFWTLHGDNYVGCLKLEVNQTANSRLILEHARRMMLQIGVHRTNIEIDYVK